MHQLSQLGRLVLGAAADCCLQLLQQPKQELLADIIGCCLTAGIITAILATDSSSSQHAEEWSLF